MARCGWRPNAESGHKPFHVAPGSCTRCWRPCYEKVDRAGDHCPQCVAALMQHPVAAVRSMLADDPNCPVDVLRTLSDDANAVVSGKARDRLLDMGDESMVGPSDKPLSLNPEDGW